jgi:hypothetical protein
MSVSRQILQYKQAGEPFSIHLADGRRFLIDHPDFVSTDPRGAGTSVMVYGHDEGEEHYIPVFAISSVSKT